MRQSAPPASAGAATRAVRWARMRLIRTYAVNWPLIGLHEVMHSIGLSCYLLEGHLWILGIRFWHAGTWHRHHKAVTHSPL